jgi:hypothetical protein
VEMTELSAEEKALCVQKIGAKLCKAWKPGHCWVSY